MHDLSVQDFKFLFQTMPRALNFIYLFIYLFHARMIEYHFNRASPSKMQGTGKYVHFDRYHFNGKYRMRTCLSEYKVTKVSAHVCE